MSDLVKVRARPRIHKSISDIDADEMDRILAEGATLPAIFYTNQQIAELEDDLIFRPSWQLVAVEPELSKPGDYVTTEIAGFGFSVPIVVVREEEGAIRAFVNVCRHRAHFVALGNGNRQSFQCTYHGWVYGLNGCLRSVPRSKEGGLPPFDELGLYALPVETWNGYIFVALERTETLSAFLGELPRVLEEQHFDFPFAKENVDPEFEYRREARADSGPSNWKTMNENNLECYHCPILHRGSFSAMYKVTPEHYLHRDYDRGTYHLSNFQDKVAETLGLTDRGSVKEYQFYYLWPNMYIESAMGVGGSGGSFARIWPAGLDGWKGETVRISIPGHHHVSAEVEAQLAEWWRLTMEEDVEVAARVQRGLHSGMYGWGYTLPESERNMRRFYAMVWDALRPAFHD